MSHLRRISVFVDEPGALPLDPAGVVVLMKLVNDERIGPRAPGEDEDAAPVGPHHHEA